MVKGSLVWAVAGAGGAPATGRVSCGRRGSRYSAPQSGHVSDQTNVRPGPAPPPPPPAKRRAPPRIPAGLRFPPERRRGHDVTRRQPEEEVGQSGRLAGALVLGDERPAGWAGRPPAASGAEPPGAAAKRDGEPLDIRFLRPFALHRTARHRRRHLFTPIVTENGSR